MTCWLSMTPNEPIFETGERETGNISITDLREYDGSTELA
jgi:hypothetical protein